MYIRETDMRSVKLLVPMHYHQTISNRLTVDERVMQISRRASYVPYITKWDSTVYTYTYSCLMEWLFGHLR